MFTVRHVVHPRALTDEGVNCPFYGNGLVKLFEIGTVLWPCACLMSVIASDIHWRFVFRKPRTENGEKKLYELVSSLNHYFKGIGQLKLACHNE